MSGKIAVVYIGPKPMKKDTVTGSRLSFPRLQPVDVESAIAVQLLDYPSVWVRAEQASDAVSAQEQAAALAEEQARILAAEEEAKRQAESYVVGDVDLGKYTSAQLATFVEAQDLDVKQGAQERVDDFRARVRDTYRAKLEATEA